MKKLSLIITLFLLGLLIHISPAKCDWSTPTPVTSKSGMDSFTVISGDGTKIAFYSFIYEEGDNEIFVVNSDGTGLTKLTHDTGDESSPSINDDGTTIAFESSSNAGRIIFIINQDTIPEFTTWIILPLLLLVTIVPVVIRERLKRKAC